MLLVTVTAPSDLLSLQQRLTESDRSFSWPVSSQYQLCVTVHATLRAGQSAPPCHLIITGYSKSYSLKIVVEELQRKGAVTTCMICNVREKIGPCLVLNLVNHEYTKLALENGCFWTHKHNFLRLECNGRENKGARTEIIHPYLASCQENNR